MTENVRKVFDILGVEPYEQFKLKIGDDCFYYFDEKLNGFKRLKYEDRFCLWYSLLENCLNYTENIIKLPKKKHVGDKKCYEFSHYGKCALCPIRCLDCRGHNVVDSLYEMLKKVAIDKNKDEGLYNFLKYRLDEEVEE